MNHTTMVKLLRKPGIRLETFDLGSLGLSRGSVLGIGIWRFSVVRFSIITFTVHIADVTKSSNKKKFMV